MIDSVGIMSDEKRVRRRRGWRRRLIWLLSSLLVFCVIGLLIRAYFIFDANQRVAEAEAEADRLDPGWRWDDLVARRAIVPDDKNGALIVLAASKELPKDWPPRTKLESKELLSELVELEEPAVQLDEELLADIEAALEAGNPAHATLREIANRPIGRFPFELSNDFMSTKLPHVDACRGLANLEYLAAILRAHQAKPEAALFHTHLLLNVGRSIGDEPTLISLLHRVMCHRLTAHALERLLGQTTVSEDELSKIQEQLLLELRQELLLPVLRGERVGMQRVYECMGTGEFEAGDLREQFDFHPIIRWLYVKCVARYGEAQALAKMNEAVELAKRPLREQVHLWSDFTESIRAEADNAKKKSPWSAIGLIMLPAIDRVASPVFKYHVALDCAVAALAAERYRLAKGRWPASWDELVPEFLPAVPMDIFADEPIRLRQLEDGLVIYSVGPDGVDDNGFLRRPSDTRKPGTDIGFRLWNPDRRRQPARAKVEEKNP